MTRAVQDNNGIPVAQGVSNADGSTPTSLGVDPTMHGIQIDDNTTGSDLSGDIAHRDDNNQPVLMGVSSADGVTPVEIYIIPTGNKLLINSN